MILSLIMLLYTKFDIGGRNRACREKTLQITIPENLDYTGVFDEVMNKYTEKHELEMVKTTNMGSLFKLTYRVILKDIAMEKEFIDKLRCRNANLEISLSKCDNTMPYEL